MPGKVKSKFQLSEEDLDDHINKLQSRCKSLKSYIAAFNKDWCKIKEFLNGDTDWEPICLELLCILVFAKLEVLKRQAYFIHYGVKSMIIHNTDKFPLYLPDVSMINVLNLRKYYSSMSIEYVASQFRTYNEPTESYETKEMKFETIRDDFQTSFSYILHLLPEILNDFKNIAALRSTFSHGKIYILIVCPLIYHLQCESD